jgi:hypothetical protein
MKRVGIMTCADCGKEALIYASGRCRTCYQVWRRGKFTAAAGADCIGINGKSKYLGIFDTTDEARLAYLDAANEYGIVT